MMSTAALPLPRRSQALPAILWGGLGSGALDITAAFIVYGSFGLKPVPLLQGIAAGLLGARAWSGGLATAGLGLFFQFFIAFSATAVYYAASRWQPFLLRQTLLSGAFYGVAVYFFMDRIVVPLSAARKHPFSFEMMVIGLTIHVFCVGLPIAIAMRRFAP